MIPKLYQKDGTTLIGALTNCIECLVEEERNGIFEVTFQYPNTESIATSLVYDNIVICDANDTLKNQKFRIYDTRRMMNNTIEVYARHISFDLAYDYINSIDITNQSCEYALNTIFRSSQFSTGYVGHSDIVNAQNYKISNCNALEAIAGKQGSIIDTYGTGAEILRDNTDIHVLNRRGNDNEVSIEYAKNLTGFELQENTDDFITRIIPFATYTPEGGTQTRVQGTTVDSQYITNYSHPFIAEIDFSDKFENNEVPTANKLQTLAQQYFTDNKCDLPKQNWKIEFIPLSKCVGYEGIEDAISLCDTVTIIDTRYNINTKAKVIKTVYDVLRERYDSMELGEPRTTLGDIVNTGSEKGEQGPPGPQGPKGEDGNIGNFPDSLPSKPTLNAKLLGFASIELDWTYENKPYYWYELYASKEKNFTPNVFDIVHKGQTSSFLYQAKPGETWYFRVCGVNSYDHRSAFSDQVEVVTTKVDNLENYFTTAAIGQAVVGSLTAEYMQSKIIKGNWIDAKNLSVTDGNGKRTLDIDSYGNVNLDVTSLKISSKDVATIENLSSNLINSSIQYYLSTSQTSLIGGNWQDTAPTWEQGKYMWQRMKYTKYDGTITYGTAVCIAGAKGDTGHQGPQGSKGDTGDKGQSLTLSTPQWYLSTSKTAQTGGSWQDTMPTVTTNKYIWTRFKNVWSNPTATTYTTPVLEQITEATKEVIKKQAEFKQDLDGFKTTVSETYTTKTDFNNLSIGGRNLLKNSNFVNEMANWSAVGVKTMVSVDSSFKFNAHNTLKVAVTGQTSDKWTGALSANLTNKKAGDIFTVSCWYYVGDKSTFDSSIAVEIKGKKVGASSHSGVAKAEVAAANIVEGKWTRLVATGKLTADFEYIYAYPWVRRNGTAWFADNKLETGDKATDWTPAPEDVDDKFANYSTTEQMNSAITQKASEITSSVETSLNGYATKSLVTQTANEVKYEFQQGGGFPNLLYNSSPKYNNDTGWGYWQATKYTYDTNYSELGFYVLDGYNNGGIMSPEVSVTGGKTYSFSFSMFAEQNCTSPSVSLSIRYANNSVEYHEVINSDNVVIWNGSNDKWWKYTFSYTMPDNAAYVHLEFSQGAIVADYARVIRIRNVMIIEGNKIYPKRWYPSPNEIQSNTTTIDVNGVNVRHSDGSRTNLNSSALDFYNSSGNLYAQVANGTYKFWDGSNYIGYLGHAGWSTDTSKRNISFAGEYGNTLTLSAKKTPSDKNYQTWLVVSGHEQTISGVNYHQGVILIQPRVSGIMHFYGQGTMGDTYPGMIFASTDAHLAIMGDSYVDIGIQYGDKRYNGIRIDEAGGNPYTTINMFGNLNMNGWSITNANMASSLSATSAQTYALRTMALNNEETYSDPTAKAITDIFPSQTPTEGEIRWTDRETYFTSEVDTGVYECYIEIPWWIAQNLENNYHVSITPTNGFYQYYVSERDSYYFIVRSDKDSMGFTFEIVGKLLDNNTIANNASIAGDQYLASDLKEPESANIVTELDTADIITDTTSNT